MSRATLETHVKEYYKDQHLTDETLDKLLQAAAADPQTEPVTPSAKPNEPRRALRQWAVAAGIAFAVTTAAVLLTTGGPNGTDVDQLRIAVAEEVAAGHKKNKPPEFVTQSYAALGASMNRLDFVPAEPGRLKPKNLALTGGRYCSLDGNIAAQIKLKDRAGVPCTLYVAKVTDKLQAVGEYARHINGVEVRVWQEGELIYGLAMPLNRVDSYNGDYLGGHLETMYSWVSLRPRG